ncbi:hypothetical protein NPX13_g10399 [Xylaria arbuscula]|uniref:Uncharacterized protein n=1 Tax=Xylaria arbuscula TaxID=114810 RepID=A0A9W8TGM4_9PEZI|nr:hypothetical protein NPX13_g10399 [Xylaria arbuscula]
MPTNQMLALLDNKEIREGFSSADDIARGMWELVTRGEKIPIRVPLGSDAWAAVVDEAGKVKAELEALGPFSASFGGSFGSEARAALGQLTQ